MVSKTMSRVHVMTSSKRVSLEVDDLVGAELTDEVEVAGGGGGDDVCSVQMSDLHGEEADSASTAMDEDAVAGMQMAAMEESLPRGERADGHAWRLQLVRA